MAVEGRRTEGKPVTQGRTGKKGDDKGLCEKKMVIDMGVCKCFLCT